MVMGEHTKPGKFGMTIYPSRQFHTREKTRKPNLCCALETFGDSALDRLCHRDEHSPDFRETTGDSIKPAPMDADIGEDDASGGRGFRVRLRKSPLRLQMRQELHAFARSFSAS